MIFFVNISAAPDDLALVIDGGSIAVIPAQRAQIHHPFFSRPEEGMRFPQVVVTPADHLPHVVDGGVERVGERVLLGGR